MSKAAPLFNNLLDSSGELTEGTTMNQNHYRIASDSMFRHAAKLLKSDDARKQMKGNVAKVYALVYSDRAASGYKVKAA